jgi:hypothetical protein
VPLFLSGPNSNEAVFGSDVESVHSSSAGSYWKL